MAEFRYGPVELYLVGFEGDRPKPAVLQALTEQLDNNTVRLIDFVIVSRADDGEITVTELDDAVEYGFGDVELDAVGLTGLDDIDELAPLIEPGTSAALVALELVFARDLASKLASSGGVVLSAERIPAPIVNAVVEAAENEGD